MTEVAHVPCPSCGRPSREDLTRCPYCGMDWTDATLDQVSLSETPSLAGTGKERQLRIDLPSDDRYAIVDELGAGGAGKVYLAFDHVLGRHVAYKVLHGAPDPAAGQHERFVSECQAAAQLEHPSIVPIHDLGIRGDRPGHSGGRSAELPGLPLHGFKPVLWDRLSHRHAAAVHGLPAVSARPRGVRGVPYRRRGELVREIEAFGDSASLCGRPEFLPPAYSACDPGASPGHGDMSRMSLAVEVLRRSARDH